MLVMIYRILFAVSFLSLECTGQSYTPANVFAHNDYEQPVPFHNAYNLRVGYIEADVFLDEAGLMVAHHRNEIRKGRTLESLYLTPLSKEVEKNDGFAYPEPSRHLTLMIDLKTEGMTTLRAIVKLLDKYPALTSCKTLRFMISGTLPDAEEWDQFPLYIFVDGRPGISYTHDQLKRVRMISTNFRSHVSWDGKGRINPEDRKKIAALLEDAHRNGKKFRFWGTPDSPDAWKELMALNVDVIGTDNVNGLIGFLKASP